MPLKFFREIAQFFHFWSSIWPDHLGYPLILTYYDGVVGLRGCLLEDIKRFFCYYEIFPMHDDFHSGNTLLLYSK